ncbi:hypothetical protein L3X38_029448 [Prunus dulcis]|uniref:Uncharacterized protein n=1 Tax=Prunus dulcis TaxID=3755 RepID=A0AAD4Z270_PRUDU|nr:hypothetical protein L3X38_029448 [Prunus dulcis]
MLHCILDTSVSREIQSHFGMKHRELILTEHIEETYQCLLLKFGIKQIRGQASRKSQTSGNIPSIPKQGDENPGAWALK